MSECMCMQPLPDSIGVCDTCDLIVPSHKMVNMGFWKPGKSGRGGQEAPVKYGKPVTISYEQLGDLSQGTADPDTVVQYTANAHWDLPAISVPRGGIQFGGSATGRFSQAARAFVSWFHVQSGETKTFTPEEYEQGRKILNALPPGMHIKCQCGRWELNPQQITFDSDHNSGLPECSECRSK